MRFHKNMKPVRCLIRVLFLLIPIIGFLEPIPIKAEAYFAGEFVQVFGVSQQDLNGDGVPDVTIIDCAFVTERDQVLVYDQNGNMSAGSQWEVVTDFQDDVWVFDAGADGSAQLIVDFDMQDEQYVAMVYDDIDGDGQTSYQLADNRVIITESAFWHVKVEIDHPWTQSGVLSGTNMIISSDGFTLQEADILGVRSASGNDGVVDTQYEIGDKDGDGVVDYQLRRHISPVLVRFSSPRLHKTAIFVQSLDHQPVPYSNAIFWPMLISKHYYEDYRYFDHTPVIAVDWEAGVIDRIGILGYPIEAGYHIISRLPLEMGTINTANFETPMAYYDMAGDQDGWPELQVRFVVNLPKDPYFPSYLYAGRIDVPNLEVCYSWDQNNDNRWDYKLDLGGNYLIDEVTDFPDFSVYSVPYEEIVPWVRQRSWDVAMLIFDNQASPDSEGMYAKGWHISRGYAEGEGIQPSGLNDEYLLGLSSQPPVENYQDIQEFMRGEYNFQYFNAPKVYLSSLDRQLHLYSAQSGVWNLGEGNYIRYANLDGDAYLDQWREERSGIIVQQLNYSQGIYLYSGGDQVILMQVETPPALFETQPPGNHAEWLSLDEQLQASQAVFSPTDFTAMLALLDGTELQIRGASMRDFRVTPQGFRFVISLFTAYTFQGEDWLGLGETLPGEYLVTYDGEFTLQPLTPADLRLEPATAEIQILPEVALQPGEIFFHLYNDGLEDARDVLVTLSASQAGQVLYESGPLTVTVLSGESTLVGFSWAATAPGAWELVAEARWGDNSFAAISDHLALQVAGAQQPGIEQSLSAFGLVQTWQTALLMLIIAVVAVVSAWLILRSLLVETAQEQEQKL